MTQIAPYHDTDSEIVRNLRRLWDIAVAQKSPRYQQWDRNNRLLHNMYGGPPAQPWMPTPRSSEIYPILANLVAWMADQHTNFYASPMVNPQDPLSDIYQRMANDLTTVLSSRWETGQFERQQRICLWDAFTFGAGILKVAWDDSLWGGLGDVIMRRVDPWCFYVDPKCTSMDDAEYVIEVRQLSLDQIERAFGRRARLAVEAHGAGESVSTPQRAPYGSASYGSQAPVLGSISGGKSFAGVTTTANNQPQSESNAQPRTPDPQRTVTLFEYWTRENREPQVLEGDPDSESLATIADRTVPDDWTVTCVARGEVLLREHARDLWPGGWQPFSRYVYDETGDFWGIALVDHMAHPQVYINRLLTAMEFNYELTGNPKLIRAKGSDADRANWSSRPGEVIDIKFNQAAANFPKFLQPPAMPDQVMQLLQFWIDRMQNTAGLSAAMQGQGGAANRMTQGSMSAIQESAFVRIRSGLTNWEFTLEDSGGKATELITLNYTVPRIVSIAGDSSQQSAIALHERHFYAPSDEGAAPLKLQIMVDAGSEMPTSLQARNAKAEKYYLMRAIDREAFLKMVNFPDRQEVIDRINKAFASGTGPALWGGTGGGGQTGTGRASQTRTGAAAGAAAAGQAREAVSSGGAA